MVQSIEYPDLPFVRPAAFGVGRRGWPAVPRVLVVHHTAGAERNTSAEDGAAYDARRTDGTSCHYFIDSNSVVQCVLTKDRANSAHFNGNTIGIQYELCGTLQTRAQWLDAVSDATITNAARQMARDCRRYGIPVRKLSAAQVAAGEWGICGHADVTYAFPQDGGSHTDPGPHFPWDVLISRVAAFLNPPKEEEFDMPLMDDRDFGAVAWRLEALVNMRTAVAGGPFKGEPVKFVSELLAVKDAVRKLSEAQPGSVALTPEQLAALGGKLPTAEQVVEALLKRVAES